MKFINLLLEEDNKLETIRKSITDKLPITIQYSGPAGEVKSGPRIDIMPIVLGTNAKSNNLVIWAYVFKGVSKKGLPNWKMFRIDRIVSASFNPKLTNFDLDQLPGYQEGKSPGMMKSLSSVDVFSPYWSDNEAPSIEVPNKPEIQPQTTAPEPEPNNVPEPTEVPTPEPEIVPDTETQTVVSPDLSKRNFSQETFGDLSSKIKDLNGQKMISKLDYDFALDNIYNRKDDEFKKYQRMISGNLKTGEGTRLRFRKEAQKEFDNILMKNNISVENQLAEIYNKFKHLIK
jgi:hypothetical protein